MNQTKTQRLPALARGYVTFVVAASAAGLFLTFGNWTPDLHVRFVVYLLITIASSGMKVTLPTVDGTMSVNYVFTLLALLELDRPQAVLLALVATIVQTFWHTKKRPRPVQLAFNLACIGLTVLAASLVLKPPWFRLFPEGEAVRLTLAPHPASCTEGCDNTVDSDNTVDGTASRIRCILSTCLSFRPGSAV